MEVVERSCKDALTLEPDTPGHEPVDQPLHLAVATEELDQTRTSHLHQKSSSLAKSTIGPRTSTKPGSLFSLTTVPNHQVRGAC
jgi:hypothetical protein